MTTKTWTTTELLSTIEGLVRQFAYTTVSGGVPCYIHGGLSALEGAFAVLNWTDPMPAPAMACQYPGCSEWATYGTPTAGGYKMCCSEHVTIYQSEMRLVATRQTREGGALMT